MQHVYCKLYGFEQLFSDLVAATGVPDAALLLQFTHMSNFLETEWVPEEFRMQHFYCKLHAYEQLFSDLVDARGVPDATLLL